MPDNFFKNLLLKYIIGLARKYRILKGEELSENGNPMKKTEK